MIQFSNIFLLSGSLLAFFIFISLIRIVLGPTVPDRAVALDTINTLVIAAMILFGAAFEEIIYIDVAIVYALLSYITTLYIAKYLERRAKK
ncbi:MAG: cation:proton antiporter [Atribacterota bacterium]|nr:cation:proton antiporter [Atribacterota bacterium]